MKSLHDRSRHFRAVAAFPLARTHLRSSKHLLQRVGDNVAYITCRNDLITSTGARHQSSPCVHLEPCRWPATPPRDRRSAGQLTTADSDLCRRVIWRHRRRRLADYPGARVVPRSGDQVRRSRRDVTHVDDN